MKRLLLLTCCVVMLLSFVGCNKNEEEILLPLNFYYCNEEITYNSPSSVIRPEVREGIQFNDSLTAYLYAYLQGPQTEGLQSLIPSDVYLIACEMEEETVSIVFNAQFSKLSGVKLTAAASALLMSIHDYTGAQTLILQAKDSKIDDKDTYVIHMDSIVLMDTLQMEEN